MNKNFKSFFLSCQKTRDAVVAALHKIKQSRGSLSQIDHNTLLNLVLDESDKSKPVIEKGKKKSKQNSIEMNAVHVEIVFV